MKLMLVAFFTVSLTVQLSGCGGNKDQTSGQVVAKVNGKEISVHQINEIVKNSRITNASEIPLLRKQVLDRLIDEQVAVEQASKENLDHNPEVVLAIEAAKRQIIANAYIKNLVTTGIKISDEDIKKYFDENPALFSQRKIYTFQDITLRKKDADLQVNSDELSKRRSPQDVVDWIKSAGIQYSTNQYTKPAEDIPLEMLDKLFKLNSLGETRFDQNDLAHILFVSNIQLAPIDIKTASPLIKNYLMNTKAKELIANKIKDLRNEANIEYLGEFKSGIKKDNQSDISNGAAGIN